MRANPGFLLVLSGFFCIGAANAQEPIGLKPFTIDYRTAAGSVIDLSSLHDAPAGSKGFIQVREGHLAKPDGTRFRIWGVDITDFAKESVHFPPKSDAPFWAATLSRLGVNCVRLHYFDIEAPRGIIAPDRDNTREFDPEQLDRLDFLVAELKKHGIYSDLNLNVGRRYKAGDGVRDYELIGEGKALTFFDPRLIELQKEYARKLLTHYNPYTKSEYRNEPAFAIIEIVNENSIVAAWDRGRLRGTKTTGPPAGWQDITPYYERELTALYNACLARKLPPADLAKLRAEAGVKDGEPIPRLTPDSFAPAPGAASAPNSASAATSAAAPNSASAATSDRASSAAAPNSASAATSDRASSAAAPNSASAATSDRASSAAAPNSASAATSDRASSAAASSTARASSSPRESSSAPESNSAHEPNSAHESGPAPAPNSVPPRAHPTAPRAASKLRFETELRFYIELESNFYRDMRDYLKQTLGCKSLLIGTSDYTYGFSSYPLISSTSLLDIVDGHGPWEARPMVNEPLNSIPARLSRSAVAGKPFVVTEHNHRFSSPYTSEGIPLLAAYGAFQDWDGIFLYTFEFKSPSYAPFIGSRADLSHDPAKLPNLAAGALMFLRPDIHRARETVARSYTSEQVLESLRVPPSNGVYFTPGLSPSVALRHESRIASLNGSPTKPVKDDDASPIVSDTKELAWYFIPHAGPVTAENDQQFSTLVGPSHGTALSGMVTVDTPRTQALVGFLSAYKQSVTNLSADVRNRFATLVLTSLDSKPIASSSRILLTATSRDANSPNNPSPTLIEPVTGRIVIRNLEGAQAVQLSALDGAGRVMGNPVRAEKTADGWALPIGDPPTVWYQIAIERK